MAAWCSPRPHRWDRPAIIAALTLSGQMKQRSLVLAAFVMFAAWQVYGASSFFHFQDRIEDNIFDLQDFFNLNVGSRLSRRARSCRRWPPTDAADARCGRGRRYLFPDACHRAALTGGACSSCDVAPRALCRPLAVSVSAV
jgi:hypothetical protein